MKPLWTVLLVIILGSIGVAVLNETLGEDWYKQLPGGEGVDDAGGDSEGGGGQRCRQPSDELTGKLPKLPASYTTKTNPCLSFADVLGRLASLVPQPDDPVPGTQDDAGEREQVQLGRGKFHRGVAAVARKVDLLAKGKDAVQCGYATDHLALATYQAQTPKWSVGLVAVVRGGADAVAETAICTLLRQIPGLTEDDQDQTDPPRLSFCFHAKRQGEFTYFWLGSTDLMCGLLNEKLGKGKNADKAPGTGNPMVWADPLKVRRDPSTRQKELGTLPFGTAIDPECQLEGNEEIIGHAGQRDKQWTKIKYGNGFGYLSNAWLASRDRNGVGGYGDCPTS